FLLDSEHLPRLPGRRAWHVHHDVALDAVEQCRRVRLRWMAGRSRTRPGVAASACFDSQPRDAPVLLAHHDPHRSQLLEERHAWPLVLGPKAMGPPGGIPRVGPPDWAAPLRGYLLEVGPVYADRGCQVLGAEDEWFAKT